MNRLPFLLIVAGALLITAWATGCNDTNPVDASMPEQTPVMKQGPGAATAVLSPAEIEDLLFLREEEKVARDVYIKMYELWGKTIFLNISQSEQKHMDAILKLLNTYSIPDPVGDRVVGDFYNMELQQMYATLIAMGEKSVEEAYGVGVEIEETDIEDLQAAIEDSDTKSIITVYSKLLKGSQQHLLSFLRHLE